MIDNKKIKKCMFLLILILNLGLISGAGLYYNIELYYDGDIKIKSIEVEFLQEKPENLYSSFENTDFEKEPENAVLKIIDSNNKEIKEILFTIPNFAYYDDIDEQGYACCGGLMILDNVTFNIYSPYYENAKEIIINKDGEETRELVSYYSKKGFNKEDYQKPGEESETYEKEKKEIRKSDVFLIAVIIAIINLIFIIYFITKKNKHKHKRYYR
ncbi:hypothetical protein GF386_00075 [Candidatus Pacearchaeota archaeon]|nr:hypothetical protein [Candidatus Pacearchaeota archaeon]MBD3282678.1 hypothetical protein [Candidatus Pacearchaeota archaeon]